MAKIVQLKPLPASIRKRTGTRLTASSDDVLRQLGCTPTACDLGLPKRLSLEDWAAVGRELGKRQDTLFWWIGAWWNHPGHSYGDRRAIVDAADWSGHAYATCANAATVERAFESSRRRELLSPKHHTECAHLPPALADKLLLWCEETLAETGRARSTRALREEINRRTARVTPRSPNPYGPSQVVNLVIEPAPVEEKQFVSLQDSSAPRYEREVQEPLGGPQLGGSEPEDSAARKAMEVALAGVRAGLKVPRLPADVRKLLEQWERQGLQVLASL